MLSVFSKTKALLAPVSGRVIDFNTVPFHRSYRTFLGRSLTGTAIIPSDTKVYAPVDGTVNVKAADSVNTEIILNSALNTIQLKGNFTSCIKKGTRVHAGDLIAVLDPGMISNTGQFTYVLLLMPDNAAARPVDCEWVQGGENEVIRLSRTE